MSSIVSLAVSPLLAWDGLYFAFVSLIFMAMLAPEYVFNICKINEFTQGLINTLTENMQTKGLATCHYQRTLPKAGPNPEPGCMSEPQDLLLGKQ